MILFQTWHFHLHFETTPIFALPTRGLEQAQNVEPSRFSEEKILNVLLTGLKNTHPFLMRSSLPHPLHHPAQLAQVLSHRFQILFYFLRDPHLATAHRYQSVPGAEKQNVTQVIEV